jgi:hypothetical protein
MSDQKREPEAIHYDREASLTKKIALTPPREAPREDHTAS